MAFPFVHPNPEKIQGGSLYRVSLLEGVDLEVTATNSVSAARKWIRRMEYYDSRHAAYRQVGVATHAHGDRPAVLTISLAKQCLIVGLPDALENKSRLAALLRDNTIRFVSSGPTLTGNLELHGLIDALALGIATGDPPTFSDLASEAVGRALVLDPEVASSDWNAWPLSVEQILLSTTQAYVSFRAAIMDRGMRALRR